MEEERKPQPLDYASPEAKRAELAIERVTRLLTAVVSVMWLVSSLILDGGRMMAFVGVAGGMALVASAIACWRAARRSTLPIAPVAVLAGALGLAMLALTAFGVL